MVQRHIVEMLDDLDGDEAAETLVFGLDGHVYEIDLSSANAEKLRIALAPFVGAARRAGGSTRLRSGHGTGQAVDDTPAIRSWARKNGFEINSRGRIPAEILAAYHSR